MTEPYCAELRGALNAAVNASGDVAQDRGCYVGVEGPRYETAAEIRMFALLGGDVIGMTNLPEVVLARERQLCYAAIAVVSNLGAGLSDRPVTREENYERTIANAARLERLVRAALGVVPPKRQCACATLARDMVRPPSLAPRA